MLPSLPNTLREAKNLGIWLGIFLLSDIRRSPAVDSNMASRMRIALFGITSTLSVRRNRVFTKPWPFASALRMRLVREIAINFRNPPFLTGCSRRIYAAIFSFWAGVMPPMPMFGRSLLYVQSRCVACSWAVRRLPNLVGIGRNSGVPIWTRWRQRPTVWQTLPKPPTA